MSGLNRFLEKFEMSMELGLRYGIVILLFLGILVAVGGSSRSYGAFKEIFDNVLWTVFVVGLLMFWRELRQLRRRLEGMHLAGADVFEEAMASLEKSEAKKRHNNKRRSS